jgi:cell division transport system ATP-binding protein
MARATNARSFDVVRQWEASEGPLAPCAVAWPAWVSIARAFVNRPLILLADEPTGNLDPATGEGIMGLLDAINRTGTTIVMATHDHRVVNAMRRRVIQLDRGVIVRDQERGVYE